MAAEEVVVAPLLVPQVEGLAAVETVLAVVGHDEAPHAHVREAERDGGVAARAVEHVAHLDGVTAPPKHGYSLPYIWLQPPSHMATGSRAWGPLAQAVGVELER